MRKKNEETGARARTFGEHLEGVGPLSLKRQTVWYTHGHKTEVAEKIF